MFFDKIIHGTQYYRSPTPLPEEWDGDLANMEQYNLDVIQIRINWRNNEIREGEYDFSDVDEVLALAEKHGRQVVIKFLLECAPQYVFDKYGGTRIGPKGEQIRGGYHGAFYGGWRPCFTNPDVQAAAVRFVEKVAERYSNRPSVILWNAWNEIRNRPLEDCFCPHCRKAFGKYLEKKFTTIENLNKFYGATEESFENINLPSMPHGFWDIYEFKKFKGGEELYNWLRFVYDAIRKYDKDRPIMSHVGFTSGFQMSIDDVCDDFTVSKAVDFWGTSIPCETAMDTPEKRMDFQMLTDYLRAVDENYFMHEIYPGIGMFRWYDTRFDMNFKLYSVLSAGAKGMMYWQYRAERVGHENDCAGLVRMDGSPREVIEEVKNYGSDLKKDNTAFAGAKAEKADIAIVVDFNSQLISEIEDSCGRDYCFDLYGPRFYYRNAHAGMYRLLRNANYKVDYLGAVHPERFKDYKVLYFPYYTMLDKNILPYLQEFMEQGGVVIADEGFGMRQPNTWMQPYDIDCKNIMTARLRERRFVSGEKVCYQGETGVVRPMKSEYAVENAEVIANFDNGTPAIRRVQCGKGWFYLFGFSLGYSYYAENAEIWTKIAEDILLQTTVEKYSYADVKNGLYEKRLQNGDEEIIFLMNATEKDHTVQLQETAVSVGGSGQLNGNTLTIPAMSSAYVRVTK